MRGGLWGWLGTFSELSSGRRWCGAAALISTQYPLQPEIALAHFSMGPGMHSPRAERAQGPREPLKGWVWWRATRALPRKAGRQRHAGLQEAECSRAATGGGRAGGRGGRDTEIPACGPSPDMRRASDAAGPGNAPPGAGDARAAGAPWGGRLGEGALFRPGPYPSGGGRDCAVHRPSPRTEVRAGSGGEPTSRRQEVGSGP